MIDVKNKRCQHENCNKLPNFNTPTETTGLFCFEHKKENMINVLSKRCQHQNCNKHPLFNLPKETTGLFCFEHKKENMINVKDKRCQHKNCNKIPNFNIPMETMGLFCSEHKKENMINVKSQRCQHENCNKIPYFNTPTETTGLFCFEHKKENMIDVKSKRCQHENCNKIPSFNTPTETTGLFCFEHKKENMISVKNKKCQHENCNKRPNFNLSSETTGLFCFEHKKENMISIKNKKCQHNGCKNASIFGFKKAQYCDEHKKDNMINFVAEFKCCECENEYDFVVKDKKYCMQHCPNKEYEIKLKKICNICDIEAKSNYICNECKKISNKKEWAIVRYVKKNIDTKCKHNESIGECSKRRPDIYYELTKHCVVVEIDEHQHNNYNDVCECARINEIVNSIGGKSVVFIRYNPDKIKNKKKEVKVELEGRLKTLIAVIKKELDEEYETFNVKLVQLYYDDDHDEYKEIKTENITDTVAI
jgi:hypothetical protein